MKTQTKIILAVGACLLAIMASLAFSVQNVLGTFSSISREADHSLQEMHAVDELARGLSGISTHIHFFVSSDGPRYRAAYEQSRSDFSRKLAAFNPEKASVNGRRLIGQLRDSHRSLERRLDRMLSLKDQARRDRATLLNLMVDVDALLELMGNDIDLYNREQRAVQAMKFSEYFQYLKARVLVLFFVLFVASAGFLVTLAVYIHRAIAAPLNTLREGANEFSMGRLGHRVAARGSSDIAALSRQFNDMAAKLERSYADLEQKLLERTHALASIDSVALTLSGSGTLKDVLTKSLQMVIGSLSGIEPRGGIFLCDQDGEHLSLITHIGLTSEFAEAESRIKMGECLCGMAAQSGELLVTGDSCEDPRHTRMRSATSHGHIIVPVKSRGVVLGVIFLYPAREFTLRPTDIQMLDAMGAQLGLAIENFRFYDEIKQSSEKFWDLFENAREILFTMDTRGNLTAVNRTAEQFTGWSKIDLVGRNIRDFLTPEGAEVVGSMLAGRRVEPRYLIEFEVVKRDGSQAFVDVIARRLERNGAIAGYQVSARDITEQRTMREMVLRAERIGAIAQVGIAVRHEINNPLTTVIGNVELLMEKYEDKDPVLVQRLEVVLNNALRIAEITKRLQEIKKEKVVDYVEGVKMTDLKNSGKEPGP